MRSKLSVLSGVAFRMFFLARPGPVALITGARFSLDNIVRIVAQYWHLALVGTALLRFTLVAATNRRFNGTARQQAKVLHVELVEGPDLAELLKQYPTRQGELMSFPLAGWSPL